MRTSARFIPSRGRRLALGTTAVVTVGLVGAYASTIGAQTSSDPIRTEIVSVDDAGVPQDLADAVVPAISDTGGVVVYETATGTDSAGRRVWIRDRIAGTTRAVAETGSVAPGISGNGCLVAYTVVASDAAALTVVDRCAVGIGSPLPIGTVLDRYQSEAGSPVLVAPPSLSFDGSTIVWSTGREIRRYVRPASGGTHVRRETFDVVGGGSPDAVTGMHTDVSADGATIVFVAGPGTAPFAPTPANIYVWTLADSRPELISATSSGDPAPSDSTSPTITADGSFVVYESSSLELRAVGPSPVTLPFVVGVDLIARTAGILVDDARRPSVSADGNHVVYQRGDAIRVLSSDASSTIDHEIVELANARPTGASSISQFGRWIVFAGPSETGDPPGSVTTSTAVWAVDRASSSPDVVDTTTSTTQPPPPTSTAPPPPTSTAVPPSSTPTTTVPEVQSLPNVPATTLPAAPNVPRFPTVYGGFPSVGLPAPRPVFASPSVPRFIPGDDIGVTAFASPVTFEPTVAGAGRRTQSAVLTNAGSGALEVTSVSIDVASGFAVVGDVCSGSSVASGSSCSVDVEFAPPTVGPLSAVLTFVVSDGSFVTAALDGEGAPEPTLDLLPAVAGAGQTVTVFGAGFPSGSTVELSRPGSSTAEPVVVDGDGTFAHVVVVLPNTPAGSAVLSVSGTPGVFADVSAELMVTNRGASSTDAALRGGPARPLGR